MFTFEQVFAADPANPSNIAQNAAVTIFAPGDVTMTPLTITDPDGQPLANPLTVNANGFGSAFAHATLDRVAWAGGGFTGFFTSYEGMKQVAVDAQAAAEAAAATAGTDAAAVATAAIGDATADADAAAASAATAASNAAASATAAANSAALVGAPADTAVETLINSASATKAALNATYVLGTSVAAKGDAVVLTDATMTAGSAVLTSASASFTSDDVGKLIYVTNAGGPWTPLKTTILSRQSATQVTLAAPAVADSWVIGGPNANCVYGTDNTAAFNAALTAAAASVLPTADLNSRYRRRKPVIIPDGNFLIGQALTPIAVSGISIFGAGRKATTLMFCEPGALLSCDTYTATPSDAYNPGLAPGLNVSDLTFSSPVFIPTSLEAHRVSTAVQDNGCGDVYMRSVLFNGFKYGFNGAYGSDFTTVDNNVYFANCDVGAYFGVGSQQVKLNGPDWYKCREGLVFEGAPHFILTGGSFEDPLISAITFDAKPTGVTRSGVPVNLSGASYDGSWSIYGTWFESNAGGSGRLAPRMVWINGDPPSAANFTGPAIRDCVLVAGGTQVGAGTASFLEMASQYMAGVVIDRLKIRGNFINYIQNNSSGSATSDTKILSTTIPSGSGINYFRGSAGSCVTDDAGIFTSGGRTFASRFSGAIPLLLSLFGSGGGGTGWAFKVRTDASSTAISGITQGGAWVGPTKLTTLSSNGAVTIDASIATVTTVTLQANATSSTITNAFTGEIITIAWKQDATGGRTYVWPTNCKFAGGSAPADTTASKATSVTFSYDGTNWNEISRAVAVG